MIRIVLFLAIVFLIIVSIGGYIASEAGWLSADLHSLYDDHFSFVTGLASVVGLLAFASSRKIRSTDFESEELDKLQKLMEAAEKLETVESNKNQTEKQLLELERKKKLMEVSVKKAGLVLFYRNQLERYEPVILAQISKNDELKLAVREMLEARERLHSLNEEIAEDENVELIRSILAEQDPKEASLQRDPIVLAANTLISMFSRFMRI